MPSNLLDAALKLSRHTDLQASKPRGVEPNPRQPIDHPQDFLVSNAGHRVYFPAQAPLTRDSFFRRLMQLNAAHYVEGKTPLFPKALSYDALAEISLAEWRSLQPGIAAQTVPMTPYEAQSVCDVSVISQAPLVAEAALAGIASNLNCDTVLDHWFRAADSEHPDVRQAIELVTTGWILRNIVALSSHPAWHVFWAAHPEETLRENLAQDCLAYLHALQKREKYTPSDLRDVQHGIVWTIDVVGHGEVARVFDIPALHECCRDGLIDLMDFHLLQHAASTSPPSKSMDQVLLDTVRIGPSLPVLTMLLERLTPEGKATWLREHAHNYLSGCVRRGDQNAVHEVIDWMDAESRTDWLLGDAWRDPPISTAIKEDHPALAAWLRNQMGEAPFRAFVFENKKIHKHFTSCSDAMFSSLFPMQNDGTPNETLMQFATQRNGYEVLRSAALCNKRSRFDKLLVRFAPFMTDLKTRAEKDLVSGIGGALRANDIAACATLLNLVNHHPWGRDILASQSSGLRYGLHALCDSGDLATLSGFFELVGPDFTAMLKEAHGASLLDNALFRKHRDVVDFLLADTRNLTHIMSQAVPVSTHRHIVQRTLDVQMFSQLFSMLPIDHQRTLLGENSDSLCFDSFASNNLEPDHYPVLSTLLDVASAPHLQMAEEIILRDDCEVPRHWSERQPNDVIAILSKLTPEARSTVLRSADGEMLENFAGHLHDVQLAMQLLSGFGEEALRLFIAESYPRMATTAAQYNNLDFLRCLLGILDPRARASILSIVAKEMRDDGNIADHFCDLLTGLSNLSPDLISAAANNVRSMEDLKQLHAACFTGVASDLIDEAKQRIFKSLVQGRSLSYAARRGDATLCGSIMQLAPSVSPSDSEAPLLHNVEKAVAAALGHDHKDVLAAMTQTSNQAVNDAVATLVRTTAPAHVDFHDAVKIIRAPYINDQTAWNQRALHAYESLKKYSDRETPIRTLFIGATDLALREHIYKSEGAKWEAQINRSSTSLLQQHLAAFHADLRAAQESQAASPSPPSARRWWRFGF